MLVTYLHRNFVKHRDATQGAQYPNSISRMSRAACRVSICCGHDSIRYRAHGLYPSPPHAGSPSAAARPPFTTMCRVLSHRCQASICRRAQGLKRPPPGLYPSPPLDGPTDIVYLSLTHRHHIWRLVVKIP
jgi:hypothetical protein